jgi:hypothetical protein
MSSKVSRILKHLFTETLASEFSFYGKRLNKRPFSDLSLKTVVVGEYIYVLFFRHKNIVFLYILRHNMLCLFSFCEILVNDIYNLFLFC